MKSAAAFACLVLLAGASASPALRADDEKKVQIKVNDEMKYDVTRIDAKAGQKVTVTLTNVGELPKVAIAHNFVILKAGTDAAAFARAAMNHEAEGYMPPELAGNVIAASKMVGAGESDTVRFIAPVAGTYDYICTFPDHFRSGMRGTLNVK